ncbi:MAG: hypothetical protein JW881_11770 [Spirochaetales bacterium]|nr:hypothetical protein [Spirochaetales bacterium]
MTLFNAAKLNRIRTGYYNPVGSDTGIFLKKPEYCLRFSFAIVEDNEDPDGYGRLKLHFPHMGSSVVSCWVPFARPYAGPERGVWTMPEIGDQVVCTFLNNNPAKPVVLGCMYTPRAKAPVSDNKDNNLKTMTTKSGSVITLDDTEGGECISIHTKDGKMRLVLDKEKGLEIVNESGDITVSCRKIIMEVEEEVNFKIDKQLEVTCKQENLAIESRKGMEYASGNNAVLSGKKVKLNGSSGVTAGVKQMAKQDDQVIGVDMHDIKVPTNSGLITVPMIPHPYVGKLADKLSDDVTINDKAAAMKGSKSKYSTPGHIPMPPGVKFAKNPNNEGEVSSGTESSVKINGREAAVLGSMVKTCGDPQPQETCTIVAVGAAVPLPIMIPGMDSEQFEKDGGFIINTRDPIAPAGGPLPQDIKRSLVDPEWSSSRVKAGEEVTLTVHLQNQYENAAVHFFVWEEGADREKDPPVTKIIASNKGGKAEAAWRYVHVHDPENPITEKPKFIFTAASYRCEEVESGGIEVYDSIKIRITTDGNEAFDKTLKVVTADKQELSKKPDDNGIIELDDIVPGMVTILYETEEKSGEKKANSSPAEEEPQKPAAEESKTKTEPPEFSGLKWLKNDSEVKKAKINDIITLAADVKNIEPDHPVRITIYEKNYKTENDFIRSDIVAVNDENRIEFGWQVIYYEDREDDEETETHTNTPEYIFTLETLDKKVTSEESPVLKTGADFELYVYDSSGELVDSGKLTLILGDGSKREVSINNGRVFVEDIPLGDVKIIYE